VGWITRDEGELGEGSNPREEDKSYIHRSRDFKMHFLINEDPPPQSLTLERVRVFQESTPRMKFSD